MAKQGDQMLELACLGPSPASATHGYGFCLASLLDLDKLLHLCLSKGRKSLKYC